MAIRSTLIQIDKKALPVLAGLTWRAGDSSGYDGFLQYNGKILAEFEWEADYYATLLPYLEGIVDGVLIEPRYEELAGQLGAATGATHYLFAPADPKLVECLAPACFQEAELGEYFNSYNAVDDLQSGARMLTALKALYDGLAKLPASAVLMLRVA